ncbi:Dihydroorotate dehydrogenase B (NAD(+)), electron transfer subunit [bioreactor metagenome]|uniref:Dihydroorotate dehydrogenase B (NAD(+)), electron transfer subunit n=1 Tax=bioreactor metagenome TaxID=1076179 RepID=A0A645JKH0_9ZZZZ
MMDKVLNMCKETNTKIFISEEKKMACGIGACLVCTCKTINGNKKTCKDGPVFRGEELEAKGEVRC